MGDNGLSWLPVIGTAINAWSQERNLEENANQARIQREWQEEMWNKNNEYNTPFAQKQRLEQAGINPFSVLAQGGADSGNSSSPAQPYERAKADFHSPMNEDAFMNSIILAQQARGMELENESKGISLKYQEQNEVKRLIKLDEEIGLMISEKKKNRQDTEYLEHLSDLTRKRIDSLVRGSEAEASISEIHLRNLQRKYDDEHAESLITRALAKANIRLSKTQQASLKQGIKESLARIRKMEFENRLTAQQVATEIEKAANYWADSVNKMTANPKIAAESAFASELQETMIDYYDALTVGSYTNSGRSVLDQLGDYWNEYNVLNSSDEVSTSRRYVRDTQGHVTEIHDTKKGISKQKRKKSKSFRRR